MINALLSITTPKMRKVQLRGGQILASIRQHMSFSWCPGGANWKTTPGQTFSAKTEASRPPVATFFSSFDIASTDQVGFAPGSRNSALLRPRIGLATGSTRYIAVAPSTPQPLRG